MKNKNLYTIKKLINLLLYLSQYTLKTAFAHARVRARIGFLIRKIISLFVNKQSGKKNSMTFYAHYCLDCEMMYFGREKNVLKPCVRCGSKNVLSGSTNKSANVAENNNQLFLGVWKMKSLKQISKWDVATAAIIIVTILGLWLGGCQMPNVQPDDIRNLASQTEQLSSQIDDFQQQTKATLESLKQNGTIDSNSLAKVEKLQSGIDAVQNKTAVIADALKNAQYSGSDGLTTVLEGARAANAASSPFNPYAPLIDVGLGLAAAFAAAMAKKNAQKTAEALAKYDAHKQGVELTMKQVSQSTNPEVKAVETQLYQNIGDARKTNVGS